MSTGDKTHSGKHGTLAAASVPYEPWFRERLAQNAEEAAEYLAAALEDEDRHVFLLALKDVAEAGGGVGRLAKATRLNRESLYRMLSASGNPELHSLSKVLSAFGLQLAVRPVVNRKGKAIVATSRTILGHKKRMAQHPAHRVATSGKRRIKVP